VLITTGRGTAAERSVTVCSFPVREVLRGAMVTVVRMDGTQVSGELIDIHECWVRIRGASEVQRVEEVQGFVIDRR